MDAGVSVAFLGGDEMMWKTRWESSATSGTTDDRTIVCYKESIADAKIDPSPIWTGFLRDPRFSPPSDGGLPENALSGTSFAVDGNSTATDITVTAAEGQMRLWATRVLPPWLRGRPPH